MTNRSTTTRVQDAVARLESEPNVWVSTASPDGDPHLVPLSLAWLDGSIVVATPIDTPTARNAAATGQARAALDSADDVVILDVDVKVVAFDQAETAVVDAFVQRVGWDPRNNPGTWCLLLLEPRRAQAWNGPAEMTGRTIMRDGAWLADG